MCPILLDKEILYFLISKNAFYPPIGRPYLQIRPKLELNQKVHLFLQRAVPPIVPTCQKGVTELI